MYLDTILEGLICCEVAGVNKILKMGGWGGGGLTLLQTMVWYTNQEFNARFSFETQFYQIKKLFFDLVL